ncbi:MAG: SDR family oxidoreductase [Pseudomonadota bacterium]
MTESGVAIVTGASGTIGLSIVQRLLSDGYRVAALDVEMRETTQANNLAYVRADVSNETEVSNAVEQVIRTFNSIDVLVNVAGIVSFGSVCGLAGEEWDRVMNTNLKSVFLMSRACAPYLCSSERGRLVSISSVLARNGGNARPWIDPAEQSNSANVAYGAAKAGVNAITAYLAREFAAAGVTVNAVAPGPIETPMTTNFPDRLKELIPLGRMGKPEDVAAAVAFLVSEEGGFITGEVINLNGGMRSD